MANGEYRSLILGGARSAVRAVRGAASSLVPERGITEVLPPVYRSPKPTMGREVVIGEEVYRIGTIQAPLSDDSEF